MACVTVNVRHPLGEGEVEVDVLIDVMGRIYIDGIHVGWAKKDAPLVELKLLAELMGCELTTDPREMVELQEVK